MNFTVRMDQESSSINSENIRGNQKLIFQYQLTSYF